MRKLRTILAVVLTLVISVACCCPAFAAEPRASDYIASCYAYASASASGSISVQVVVRSQSGKTMTEIGAKKIIVQESKNGTTWTSVATLTSKDNSRFLASGSRYDRTHTVYSGTSGYQYRCIVSCYAGNSTGGDTVSYTSNAVTA